MIEMISRLLTKESRLKQKMRPQTRQKRYQVPLLSASLPQRIILTVRHGIGARHHNEIWSKSIMPVD